eukprot:9467898-Pyramimonas_sp.AAC.1
MSGTLYHLVPKTSWIKSKLFGEDYFPPTYAQVCGNDQGEPAYVSVFSPHPGLLEVSGTHGRSWKRPN